MRFRNRKKIALSLTSQFEELNKEYCNRDQKHDTSKLLLLCQTVSVQFLRYVFVLRVLEHFLSQRVVQGGCFSPAIIPVVVILKVLLVHNDKHGFTIGIEFDRPHWRRITNCVLVPLATKPTPAIYYSTCFCLFVMQLPIFSVFKSSLLQSCWMNSVDWLNR